LDHHVVRAGDRLDVEMIRHGLESLDQKPQQPLECNPHRTINGRALPHMVVPYPMMRAIHEMLGKRPQQHIQRRKRVPVSPAHPQQW
jgi:hypothetical protein